MFIKSYRTIENLLSKLRTRFYLNMVWKSKICVRPDPLSIIEVSGTQFALSLADSAVPLAARQISFVFQDIGRLGSNTEEKVLENAPK